MPFWLRTRSLSSTQLMAAPARARLVRGVASRLGGGRRLLPRSAASKPQATSLKDDSCTAFLHWLQRKAGTQISSVLDVATSTFGRSLFALEPIQEGDCILEVPYGVQLTQDKLPQEVCMLLDNLVGDTAKIAVLLILEQHLGHASGWEPYIKSLPCKDQMHNMMFWDLNELHMVRNSAVYNEAIEQRELVKKEFSAVKPVLECFPHLFGEVKLEDFMHACALVSSRAWLTSRDFLNHDGRSNSILLYDEQKDVSEVIADRNYAVGEQVMIRYGKYSNAVLALNFGFTLSRNIYDQAQTWVDMEDQDSFSREKLATWLRHHHGPKSEDMFSCNYTKASFVIKEVKFCGGKGVGVPQILRAFFRVFYATSLEELEEMSTEAARDDGRLARRPLENREREIHAHRMLLLHLDEEIQGYFTAIEHLGIASDPESRSVHPFRKEMAKDLLVGELRVLRSARAWVATYCETLSTS
ncbi:fructose-bisphosphate aldolase-lysine N-methyltransferase, chloroplastic isoform X2 [Setaria viridis]|uniref:fructose-bisphosphate aldolase-lysine N-methyltransferase, chloroplastic isoform X2 n=1 Tax=Setaria viridis TaxID=4556 RepID=UPI0014938B9E|nr:ribulose-1,5 bisphosphate carboxylase/oxygenase large subunit N-methyltransferase, chloroplastic isoform X2 [Setaria viridis]